MSEGAVAAVLDAPASFVTAAQPRPVPAAGYATPSPVLSIIVPTFNERLNVSELVTRLDAVLKAIPWEVVFVDDDSPDGTAALIRSLAQQDGRVRCIQRFGRRGLSSACIEGILATSAPFVAVMDADLQHDERLLCEMLEQLHAEDLDIVVGSRYVAGGGIGAWQSDRAAMSRLATSLSRLVFRAELNDPMSGFFMMRRDAFMDTARRLSSMGFKILLDIFASAPKPLKFREIPFEFRSRFAGESKLDSAAMWEYGVLLLDKLIGHVVPVRFVMFSMVGGLGLGIHLAVLAMMLNVAGVGFDLSQTIATVVAMTGNFLLNNTITYRDKRLQGARLITGLLSFYAACAVGIVANVGVASYIFQQDYAWWVSAVAGVAVGAVWNYAATSIFTWRKS
jgi:dolichol-phosphate mannosyltransferase